MRRHHHDRATSPSGPRVVGRARRRAGLVAGLLAAGLLLPSAADAKTYSLTYDFGNPRSGNAGWRADNAPPGNTPEGGWYSSTFGVGPGLRIVPVGRGDTPYDQVRGTWSLDVPEGASLKRARVEGLSGRAADRQIGRAWLSGLVPDFPEPRPSSVSREIRQAGGTPLQWDDAAFSLTAPAGVTARGFSLWLYTNPCGTPTLGDCQPVPPNTAAFVSLRKVTLTVDDPSKADATIDGLGDGTLWTSSRDIDLRVAGSDPQSGIAKITAEVRTASGTRRLELGEWRPDTLGATPREAPKPPLATDRAVSRSLTAASSGRTRVTIRTTNGTGATTVSRGEVRVDREKPTITWPRTLKPGAAVVLRDGDSGAAEARLVIGERVVQDSCAKGAKRCVVRLPDDLPSRATVEAKITDVAGNARTASRRAAKNGNEPDPGATPPKGPPVLDGELALDVSDVPASEDVWYGIYAKPDHADDPALDAEDALPLTEGVVKGGTVRTVNPRTTDPAAAQYVARRNGVLNVTIIARSAGRLTARPAVWYLRSRGAAAAQTRAVVRTERARASTRAVGEKPAGPQRPRPLPSTPRVGGAVVPDRMLRPRVRVEFDEFSAAATPSTGSASSGPTGPSGFSQVGSSGDPFEPGSSKPSPGRASAMVKAASGLGPGWRKLSRGREDFIDDYGFSQLPPEAARGVCNAGTKGKDGFGTGVWQYRAGQNVWFPVKSVQTVRGMEYTLTVTADKLTGVSGAVTAGGKVKGVPIGGSATVTKSEQESFSIGRSFRDSKRRRVVQLPIVYRTFHWKIGCGYDSAKKTYRENFEFREAVPTRVGLVGMRADPKQSLPFVPCDRAPAGRSSKHYGGVDGSSGIFSRARSATRIEDVGAEISLLGLGVKVGLNTAETTTVAERVNLTGRKPFRACTWKNLGGGKNGDPAWREHPEATWLWDR